MVYLLKIVIFHGYVNLHDVSCPERHHNQGESALKLRRRVLAGKAQQPAVGDPTATWKKRGEPTALVDGGLPPDNSTLFLVIHYRWRFYIR